MANEPYHITNNEHGPYVVVSAAILMTYTILCCLARFLMRFTINGPLGLDDWTVTVGSVVAAIQSILKICEAKQGLGKRVNVIPIENLNSVGKLALAGDIFYVIGMAFSRSASFLLVARLTRKTRYARAAFAGVIIAAVSGFASVLVLTMRCHFGPWMMVPRCSGAFTRWYVIEGLGIFVELLVSGLPIYLVQGLHMKLKAKLMVLFAFSFRVPVIVIIAFRIYFLYWESVKGDPLFDGATSSVFLEVALHYALMAATIPCLKPFLKAFDSGTFQSIDLSIPRYTESYSLANMSRAAHSAKTEIENAVEGSSLLQGPSRGRRPDKPGRLETPPSSSGSDKMIIRRTTVWDVSYEANIPTVSRH